MLVFEHVSSTREKCAGSTLRDADHRFQLWGLHAKGKNQRKFWDFVDTLGSNMTCWRSSVHYNCSSGPPNARSTAENLPGYVTSRIKFSSVPTCVRPSCIASPCTGFKGFMSSFVENISSLWCFFHVYAEKEVHNYVLWIMSWIWAHFNCPAGEAWIPTSPYLAKGLHSCTQVLTVYVKSCVLLKWNINWWQNLTHYCRKRFVVRSGVLASLALLYA